MKKSAKKAKAPKADMPDFVTGMLKLVERLEVLEKKTDMILGRVSNLPSEMRNAVQQLQRSQPSSYAPPVSRPDPGFQQNQPVREKVLFEATCADCLKGCKVPFRPSANRPVYCPECFAIRKAGHAPKDLASNIVVPQHLRDLKKVSAVETKAVVPSVANKPVSKPAKKHTGKAAKKSAKKKKK